VYNIYSEIENSTRAIISASFGGFGKKVAIYGRCVIRGRIEGSRRYEFYNGSGRDLYRCVSYAVHHPPKRHFESVTVDEFLSNPLKHSTEGYWIDHKVES
jgi:hypothetical protein